jgi:hypothetical protein
MTLAKHPPRIGVFWINILDIPLIKMLHPLFVQTSRKSPTSFAGNDNFYVVVIVYIAIIVVVIMDIIIFVVTEGRGTAFGIFTEAVGGGGGKGTMYCRAQQHEGRRYIRPGGCVRKKMVSRKICWA